MGMPDTARRYTVDEVLAFWSLTWARCSGACPSRLGDPRHRGFPLASCVALIALTPSVPCMVSPALPGIDHAGD